MNASPSERKALSLLSVRRISRWMVAACRVLLVGLPLALVFYWATASEVMLAGHANLPPQAIQGPLALWQRVAAGAVTGVPLVLLLMGVWQARRCFAMFAQGKVFTLQATSLLRRFAGWVAWAALAALLAGVATSVLLTLHNPPGQRHLAIGIGSDHVFTLFFAGLVWLMAAVIGEGQTLAEENEGFV
ncbi:DUF2975 domain-containing protein [Hydrogenophaga sp. RWCD_12]|uniref:DUF2975 domain-containing protein n=1 Tax=Hydrogenophaga sp. RWCD_12 TaxID=3391190 RepID=UPI0039853FFB